MRIPCGVNGSNVNASSGISWNAAINDVKGASDETASLDLIMLSFRYFVDSMGRVA